MGDTCLRLRLPAHAATGRAAQTAGRRLRARAPQSTRPAAFRPAAFRRSAVRVGAPSARSGDAGKQRAQQREEGREGRGREEGGGDGAESREQRPVSGSVAWPAVAAGAARRVPPRRRRVVAQPRVRVPPRAQGGGEGRPRLGRAVLCRLDSVVRLHHSAATRLRDREWAKEERLRRPRAGVRYGQGERRRRRRGNEPAGKGGRRQGGHHKRRDRS
mmetsp:Transcript_18015/g.58062  ORF Transcript_18015/g.58062 Transcript_18015/m.58062 type:complete len:216 (+) Transcript_18015:245-892(+)